MTEYKNQTVQITYTPGQYATMPNQIVEEIDREDGMIFGVVRGTDVDIFCATWGDVPNNTWHATRGSICRR
jgi:hypothetical protein